MNRAETESFIVDSARSFLNESKMSNLKDGTNPDLSQPIDLALRRVGIFPATAGLPTDDDIEQVPPGAILYFKCLCMAESFLAIAGRLSKVDQSMPASGQRLSQYIDQALKMAGYWEERAKNFEVKTDDPSAEIGGIAIGYMKYRTPGELVLDHPSRWW
jgi:hypothetical protein